MFKEESKIEPNQTEKKMFKAFVVTFQKNGSIIWLLLIWNNFSFHLKMILITNQSWLILGKSVLGDLNAVAN